MNERINETDQGVIVINNEKTTGFMESSDASSEQIVTQENGNITFC